ncbi:MAG TPA: hypothetical protein VMX75_05325 [Spirochaetia bacterium]|nr:hypothetical protein [Spirochaetia bacterium]
MRGEDRAPGSDRNFGKETVRGRRIPKEPRAGESRSDTDNESGADNESIAENKKAARVERGSLKNAAVTNAELKQLLDKALVRFGNWKVQMESNPNPRMVHSLKNIVSIIDTITSISERKIQYSYKDLSAKMSLLIDGVAKLNLLITNSLLDDDSIDRMEEELINTQMLIVIQRTVELIRMVQEAFGVSNRLVDRSVKRLPDSASTGRKSKVE